MRFSARVSDGVAAMTVGALLALPADARSNEWEWTIVPYLWGAATELDVTLPSGQEFESELDFSGLIDKLDFAAQVHLEARRHRLGFFGDVTYIATSDDTTTPPRPVLPGGATISSDTDTWMLEGGGFYRVAGDQLGLDLLLGLRVVDLELSVDVVPPPPARQRFSGETSGTLYDGFAGVRYSTAFGSNWLLSLRADVGTGDTDRSYNLVGTVGYRFGADDRYGLTLGYRHLVLDLEDGGFKVEQTMSGPQLGFLFQL